MLLTPIRKANDLRIPLIVGEWGDLRGTTGGAAYQAQMLAIFRRYGLSWARWALSAHDVFGILNAPVPADRGVPAAAARAPGRLAATAAAGAAPAGVRRVAVDALARGRRRPPLLLCTRPAARSRRTTISMRDADGRLIRHIDMGPVAAGPGRLPALARRQRQGRPRPPGQGVHPRLSPVRGGAQVQRVAGGRRPAVTVETPARAEAPRPGPGRPARVRSRAAAAEDGQEDRVRRADAGHVVPAGAG